MKNILKIRLWKIALVSILTTVLLFFASCEKQDTKPETKVITQSFTLAPVVNDISKKSTFDPEQWVHNYSTTPYTLNISNNTNTYTIDVSIQELLTGTVSLEMVTGTYDIIYTPTHSQDFDNNLDVAINMTDVEINGSPVTLQGTINDALIILDLQDITYVDLMNHSGSFTQDPQGFYFAYTALPEYNFRLEFNVYPDLVYINNNSVELGKVYWYVDQLGATLELNIPEMSIQKEGVIKP